MKREEIVNLRHELRRCAEKPDDFGEERRGELIEEAADAIDELLACTVDGAYAEDNIEQHARRLAEDLWEPFVLGQVRSGPYSIKQIFVEVVAPQLRALLRENLYARRREHARIKAAVNEALR